MTPSAAQVARLVALCALVSASAVAAARSKPPTFVVQVQEGEMEQVVAAYQARGFQIQSINTNHGFLKVSHPTALPAAAVASVSPPAAAGGRAAPAWLPPHAWSQARALSPGDGPEGPIYPRGAEAAARAAAALSPAGEPEAVAATWGGAPTTMQVSTMAASPTIAAAIAALSEVPGVDTVEVNVQAHLMRSKHYARTLQQAMAAAGGSGVCAGAKPKNGPDTDTGKFGEAAPYGVTMVQADAPEMVEVSKAHAGKVIFCVLDTGLDRSNVEFEHGSMIGGCVPDTVRPGGNATKCVYNWWDDTMGHGTHTSGTIGAMRNGRGIVGVSAEGAQIYHVNSFGDSDTFDFSDIVMSWDDCIDELEVRKRATGQADMKMIISMSLGAGGDLSVVRSAVRRIASQRNDILFVSAAGNGGSAATAYPAGYPEVVSIAAVDWNMNKAHFSQYNPDVEWAAPGVQVLSTIPAANAPTSQYNLRPRVTITPTSDVFTAGVGPLLLPGGATGKAVTAGLVDCDLGLAPCANAEGKVCLLRRGEATFCSKVNNCVAGGGVGAIIYEKQDTPDQCAPLSGATLKDPSCDEPAGGWPIVLTTSWAQGKALQRLARAQRVTLTLDTTVGKDVPALDFMSGTSMATPNAAGVAGLVWSAHPTCSASELRRAISATAIDRGATGRDEQYGFGVIQSLSAHHYLRDNPCSGRNVRFDRIGAQNEAGPAQPYDVSVPPAVSAPINERVALPYVLGARSACPDASDHVIMAVEIGRRLRRCQHALHYVQLRQARASVREACNPANSKGVYAFTATRARAAPGDCYELEITTVDNQVLHSVLMFTD